MSAVLDRSKMPPDLHVHRAWVADRGEHAVVYVTERRRRLIGGCVIGAGFIAMLAGFFAHAPIWLALIALAVTVGGAVYAAGGRSGFYAVADDGSLGNYLGRTKPPLDSMRAMKIQ